MVSPPRKSSVFDTFFYNLSITLYVSLSTLTIIGRIGKDTYMKNVSYRIDALSVTLNPEVNLEIEMRKAGYELRDPEENDVLHRASSYDVRRAKVLDFEVGHDKPFSLTVQNREEMDKPNSGFFAMKGGTLDFVDYRKLLRSLQNMTKATRIDIACDIEFETTEEMYEKFLHLTDLCGFDRNSPNPFVQNPELSKIESGTRKSSRPIRSAKMYGSNGLTLYIGGDQSKFRIRAYDKSAEVMANSGIEIPPTLRIELEAKKEIGDGVLKILEQEEKTNSEMSEMLWHSLTEERISFPEGTLADIMEIDSREIIEIDYSKRESQELGFEKWVKQQVVPSFHAHTEGMSMEAKLEKLAVLFQLKTTSE